MPKANTKFLGKPRTKRKTFDPAVDKHHYNCPKTKKWKGVV